MNIDRVQGMIDLYTKAGKSRQAVLTMADYYLRQGLITQADVEIVQVALDVQDGMQEPLDIKAVLAEREELRTQVAELSEQRDTAVAGQEMLQDAQAKLQPAEAVSSEVKSL